VTHRARTILAFLLPATLTLITLFVLVFFYLLPFQYDNLLDQKKEALQGVVDIALTIVEDQYQLSVTGAISEEEAMANAIGTTEHLRWGPYEENYCYLFTLEGILLAHPYNPELVGFNLKEVIEGGGRSLGELLLQGVADPESPYVVYEWNQPNETETSEKLNFVRLFAPWNWVIGGGIYFEDIQTLYLQQQRRILAIFLVVAAVISFLLAVMIRRGLKADELRTRSEVELRSSEQKFRDIYDNMAAFVGMLKVDGTFLDANRTSTDFLSIHSESFVGKHIWDTPWWEDDPEQQRLLHIAHAEALRTGQMQRFDTIHRALDGKEMIVDFCMKPNFDALGAVRNFIVEGVDVTERRQTEETLRQSQKLDAIGHLAGGIAHDFNNMLAAILGSADLMVQESQDPALVRKYSNLIINTVENAAKLTSKLLAFSRKGKVVSIPIDVHECLNDALDILSRTIDRSILMERGLNAQTSTVIGDPVQIQNAIINLGVNASHAMPEGGTLTVSTENVVLDETDCKTLPFDVVPGDYLCVEVRDTGTGIPPQNLDRIFEPFYTTKEVGQGTGLGLATIHGMANDHHGAIRVESTENEGSCFSLYLPSEVAEVPATRPEVVEELSGSGCVLVIDDEGIILTTAMTMLEQLGYEVLLAEDGKVGVKVYRENQHKIDIVLMDMVMPRMSGLVCLKHLREINPNVRVILSSGFVQKEPPAEVTEGHVIAVLEKPYRFHELAKALRTAMES
jgi:PAS domain S-box-containing protein